MFLFSLTITGPQKQNLDHFFLSLKSEKNKIIYILKIDFCYNTSE